jgi:hypothetical protein
MRGGVVAPKNKQERCPPSYAPPCSFSPFSLRASPAWKWWIRNVAHTDSMKNTQSLPRRGTQLAALQVIKETPQLCYQLLGLIGLKEDLIVNATRAMHAALENGNHAILGKINLESESGDAAVVIHDEVVVEMVIKASGSTVVRIKPTGKAADNCYLLLGRGTLQSQTNVDVEAPPRRTPDSNFKADRRLPLTA